MRRFYLSILIGVIAVLLAACSQQPVSSPTPQPAATSPLIALLPASTPSETTSGLLLLPTPQLVDSLEAAVQANSNIRSGPGALFAVIATFAQEQQVVVTRQAPGGNWFYVDNGDQSGWVNMHLVMLSGDANQLRPIDPADVLVIKGHIYTPNGSPAYGVGVSLLRKLSNDTPQVDVAYSNDAGEWYLFLPPTETGTWVVRPDSYGCDSNAVNTGCSLIGHFPEPQQMTLPLPAGTWIDFTLLP